MSESEEEILDHNARVLWSEVAATLASAKESVEQAQGALEDLGEGSFADLLQPIADNLSRASTDALSRA